MSLDFVKWHWGDGEMGEGTLPELKTTGLNQSSSLCERDQELQPYETRHLENEQLESRVCSLRGRICLLHL